MHKLLTSALDNAKYVAGEEGTDLDVDNLYVKQAAANDAPRMKRIRPAPMGRAYRYQRRLAHIVLSVAEREGAAGLVTTVEEPVASAKTEKAKKASRAGAKGKQAAPKKPSANVAKAEAEETKPAAKKAAASKKKAEK